VFSSKELSTEDEMTKEAVLEFYNDRIKGYNIQ
jgi:hypothetical protein